MTVAADEVPMSIARVLYVQCSAGVAGDMLLGALIDAGADRVAVMDTLAGLDVGGYALTFERVQRGVWRRRGPTWSSTTATTTITGTSPTVVTEPIRTGRRR